MLVVMPISVLVAFLAVWGAELKISAPVFFKTKFGKLFIAIVFISVIFDAVWAFKKVSSGLKIANANYQSTEHRDLPENYAQLSHPAPEYNLVDQHAEVITDKTFIGHTVLMTFAFAHCQTVCPTLVSQALVALKELEDLDVKLVVITLDPWRDTPKSLPTLAQKWKLPAQAHVLSGDVSTVNEVLTNYQIATKRNENDGDIVHPALTYVINKSGHIVYKFNNASPKWMVQAVNRLASQ